jgi:hypothetical protein
MLGKAKIFLSRLRIRISMFRVYRILWLNISVTGVHRDPELGEEISNFASPDPVHLLFIR